MYLNVIQLAESLGVEENVIESWVSKERLPAIEDRGRLVFDRAQVLQWAAERGLAAKAGFLAAAPASSSQGERLTGFLKNGGIWRDVASGQVFTVLEGLLRNFPGATPQVRQILLQRLKSAGGITWAPVGGGFALPHLRAHVALGRDMGLLAVLLLKEPLPLQESLPDGVPITRLLFFVAPSPRAHLELLAALSTGLTRTGLRKLLAEAAPDSAIMEAFSRLEVESGKAGK